MYALAISRPILDWLQHNVENLLVRWTEVVQMAGLNQASITVAHPSLYYALVLICMPAVAFEKIHLPLKLQSIVRCILRHINIAREVHS